MSITGFEDAIKDNVASYSNNLDALRATNVTQRNNALAGIQSEVEKYGEMAKLGLEIPVAVEGLKAVGGRAKDLVNYVKGARGKLEEGISKAKGAVADAKGAVNTALSRGKNVISQAKGAAGNIREQVISKAKGGMNIDDMSERFDNLRTGGETKIQSFNPTQRLKEEGMKSQTGTDGKEMRRPRVSGDDLGDDPDPYGRDAPGMGDDKVTGEPTTARPAESKPMFEEDTDEFGLPKESEPLGTGEPSLFSHEEPRFSTSRSLDAGAENDRMGIGNMSRQPNTTQGADMKDRNPNSFRDTGETKEPTETSAMEDMNTRPTMISQDSEGYNEVNRTENPDYKPARPTSKAPGAGEYDDDLSSAAKQAVSTEGEATEGLSGLGDAAAAATGGEITGGIEEGIGAGLLASGIFAPLGALLEGIGAVTEVGSVAAGAYGAVESFSEMGSEEALRKKAMPQVSQPTLDLGGRVAAPVLA